MQVELSRRERQIMNIVYEKGQATAQEVRDGMSDAPSYSAVRALLKVLEEKGHLKHEEDGPRYVYLPTSPRAHVAVSALKQVVQTFFGGSATKAALTLISDREADLTTADIERLEKLIEELKQR